MQQGFVRSYSFWNTFTSLSTGMGQNDPDHLQFEISFVRYIFDGWTSGSKYIVTEENLDS